MIAHWIEYSCEKAAKKEVESKLKEISEQAEKAKGKAVEELLLAVGTVEPKLHVNIKVHE